MARSLAVLPLALATSCLVAACSSKDDAPAEASPPAALTFGEPGSLSADSGKGGFRFGAASAATQVEDQNEHTDWWVWTAPTDKGGLAKSTFVGDASKGYTMAKDDVALLSQMGLDSYRFSIEWARIEPQRNQIDEAALQHYSDLIDALRAANIRPIVTLHHFSNPTWIDDPRDTACANGPTDANLCGWGHPVGGPLVVKEFEEHAKLLAERFGDRVDDWGTLNEPVNYLVAGYGIGQFPPGKQNIFDLVTKFVPVVRDYLAGSVAAYKAVKAADTKDADGDGVAAEVGLSLNVIDWEAARFNAPSTDPEDLAAKDKVVYVYHHLVVQSLLDGTFDTNLDGTPDEEHPEWKGALDWLGLQYYTRTGVTGKDGLIPVLKVTPCFPPAFDFGACLPPLEITHCRPTMADEYYEPGLHDIIMDYATRWPALPLVVTEGGIPTEVGARRAENVVRSLEQIARAQAEGADVRGYYHWSLYDNFEWSSGFKPRFGLYRVDYSSYARTATEGATVFGDIAKARTLTTEERQRYGGTGPMTPEPVKEGEYTFCSGK